jgi:hypothetical protein
MGFLDRLFGRSNPPEQQRPQYSPGYDSYAGRQASGQGQERDQTQRQYPPPYARYEPTVPGGQEQLSDEQAVARYLYLLRTAPPDIIEQVHAEAFAKLTPEQRRMVLQMLSQELPEYERRAVNEEAVAQDPQALARLATRAEARQPGTLERVFSSAPSTMGAGIGLGGLMAGSFLSSLAGVVVGSMIAQAFFDHSYHGDAGLPAEAGADVQQPEGTEGTYDQSTEYGGYDSYGGDYGGYEAGDAGYGDVSFGDFGDIGGDIGDVGGDFGG